LLVVEIGVVVLVDGRCEPNRQLVRERERGERRDRRKEGVFIVDEKRVG
jgi:hypothetical protein